MVAVVEGRYDTEFVHRKSSVMTLVVMGGRRGDNFAYKGSLAKIASVLEGFVSDDADGWLLW